MNAKIGLVAGRGIYPLKVLEGARAKGVSVVVAAFQGETEARVGARGQPTEWLRVGQLGKLISFFKKEGVEEAIFAGQITPKRLFDLRPDWQAMWLLARLKEKNAATLFGAVVEALGKAGVKVLPATTFMEDHVAKGGILAGPNPPKNLGAEVAMGWPLAKAVARLQIGQTVVVKRGTVMAVEGFEGTDEALRRGGKLGGGESVAIKVTAPGQDMRFDVPVIGPRTVRAAAEGKVRVLVVEAGRTLILELAEVKKLAEEHKITVWGASGKGAK